jgi:putative SOS response-associated peptidase YedK
VRRDDNLADLDTGPRFNGGPSRRYPLIVPDKGTSAGAFSLATWGFIPRWSREAKPTRTPPNARSETVATNGMFRDAYRSRRCLVPVDGYFEWKAIKGPEATLYARHG